MNEHDGRGLTRFTLIFTLVLSIIANVTHSVLADSEISLWLRVPGGVIWPTLTFLAIEIIVRVRWESRPTHYLARFFVLGPAVPAAIVSYDHQRNLLIMMGETGIVPIIGPLVIDGLMIGCTLALLFTRQVAIDQVAISQVAVSEVAEETEVQLDSPVVQEAEAITAEAAQPALPQPAQRARTGSGSAALAEAIDALRDGASVKQAATVSGMSQPAVRKYAAVMRLLADDVNASIDTRKMGVRAAVVDDMRAHARMMATR